MVTRLGGDSQHPDGPIAERLSRVVESFLPSPGLHKLAFLTGSSPRKSVTALPFGCRSRPWPREPMGTLAEDSFRARASG